jgi:hypothetical protein
MSSEFAPPSSNCEYELISSEENAKTNSEFLAMMDESLLKIQEWKRKHEQDE